MKNLFPLLNIQALGNEAPVLPANADLRPGMIALANESRFNAAHYSESLTGFTSGYRDPENLIAAVDYLAPPIPVGRRFDWKKADSSKAYVSEIEDDERPIGGAFKLVEFAGSEQTSKTRNRGLSTVIDEDEEGGAMTEEEATAMLLQRIHRNKYRRAMTTLNAISAGSAATFSSATQPDEIMKAALADAQLESGVFPNRGLIGLAAWNLRSAGFAPQNNAGANAGLVKTAAQVAGDLMLDDLRVDKAIVQTTVTAKARIVTSAFYGFLAYDGLTRNDPSHLKQFYTRIGQGRYRVFIERQLKRKIVTVEHYESIIGTGTLGLARRNIT